MADYYIIGSGGFAKEVYLLAESVLDSTYSFRGFIDKQPETDTEKVRGRDEKIFSEDFFLKNIEPSENVHLYMGVGDASLLTELAEKFKSYEFPNLISGDLFFDKRSVKMGRGNIVTAGCIFTVDIEMGSYNVFNLTTTIGHDVKMGSCNIFNPGTNISGSVEIGSSNLFGTGSTVLQHISIGNGNVLGAASLANKSFTDHNIMIGVPAKKLQR